jgi:hypothetical protein
MAHKCPTCHEDGQYVTCRSARVEQLHFVQRALWDLHRLRQALQEERRDVLAGTVSVLIREADTIANILLDGDR